MTTFWVILGLVVVAFGVYAWYYKQGKINDADKDFIPDEVEEAVEDAKKVAKEVKRRAKRVKEEIADVVEEAKDVVEQAKDVVDAAKGKTRRGRKPKSKK